MIPTTCPRCGRSTVDGIASLSTAEIFRCYSCRVTFTTPTSEEETVTTFTTTETNFARETARRVFESGMTGVESVDVNVDGRTARVFADGTVVEVEAEGDAPSARPLVEVEAGQTFTAVSAIGRPVTLTVAGPDSPLVTADYPAVEIVADDGHVFVRGLEGCALFAPGTIAEVLS